MAEGGTDTTYGQHMRWCKDRALAYLDQGDMMNALASMASDVTKHYETNTPAVTMLLGLEGLRCVQANDLRGMRRLIEGFASD